MIISTSNNLAELTPLVTSGAGTDQPANISNLDLQLNYTASSSILIIEFGPITASYIGLLAFNIGKGLISISDMGASVANLTIEHDQVVMLTFEQRTFTNLKLTIFSSDALKPTVAYCAAGDSWEIPNGGEQSGYNRTWLSHGIRSRVKTNDQGFPTAELVTVEPSKMALSIPNLTLEYCRNEWQELINFTHRDRNHFFIKESPDVDGKNLTCVMGFDAMTSGTAHSQTRALNDVSLQFRGLNKIYV